MTLAPGSRLGLYEILAPIGKGGMGEVWRGRDTRLDRIVAIKVLPAALSDDGERLARFEREAKVLASLNHPNIAQIYGVEGNALVMECIEGQPLGGPVPVDIARSYASQIVDALEAAHDKGIVHRDLKPANILVTGDGVVKVLDFGLAAVTPTSGAGDLANSPTLSLSPSMPGAIMGTAAYMAPEQARGRTIDRRADIWALGVVLYELTTGRQLFSGDTAAETLAEVLKAETDLSSVPSELRPIVERCLRRDPKLRWQAVGDIRIALAEPLPTATQTVSGPVKHSRVGWAAAAVMTVVALGAWFAHVRQPAAIGPEPLRFDVDLGVPSPISNLSLSPGAHQIAFSTIRDGLSAVVVKSLHDGKERVLTSGPRNVRSITFSPDGKWIAYSVVTQLMKVSVAGGQPLVLAEVGNTRGLSWPGDGYIYYGLNPGSILRVAEDGGAPEPVFGNSSGRRYRWPQMLPGNTHLLVSAWNTSGPDAVEVLDRASGKAQSVVTGASFARYFQAPDGSEYLVYAVGSSLYGVRFNLGALRTEGSPVLLASESTIPPDMGFMDVSGDAQSILTYLTGTLSGASVRTSIASLDSSGNTTPIASSVAAYYTPRYSPDGQLLAYVKDGDIWTHDSITGVSTQRTFAARAVGEIAWTPDGRHLLYSAQNKIWWLRADGSGQPLALISGDETFRVFSVSPDGRTVSVGVNRLGLPDLYFLPLDTSNSERPVAGKLTPFVVTPEPEAQGEFSPDGRWIAYSVSGQADGAQVFVQPFPPNGSKWRVSAVEGDFPQWSRDGHLYYLAGDQIMVTDWSVSGGAFSTGRPRVWSPTRIQPIANQLPLALHPDGKHFAVFPKPTTEREHLHAVFMLNPVELIRRGLTAK